MLLIPDLFIQAENTPSKSQELIEQRVKPKINSAKKKSCTSNKTIPQKKRRSDFLVPEKLAKKFVTSDSLNKISSITKAKKVSKLGRIEHSTSLSKAKYMNDTSVNILATVENSKYKKNISNIIKTKKPLKDLNLNLTTHNKGELKKSTTSKLCTKTNKLQPSTITNETKIDRHTRKPTKMTNDKNSIEKLSEDSKKSTTKLKRPLNSALHKKHPLKMPQKYLKNMSIQTSNENIEEQIMEDAKETKQKWPERQKSNISTMKIVPTLKTSTSLRKRGTNNNTYTALHMPRKINSFELMNKVYPRVEMSTENVSNIKSKNRPKSDIIPTRTHPHNRKNVGLKSKTLLDFKKPGSAPEEGKQLHRLQRFNSSVSSKHPLSHNSSKVSMGLAPKWQVQKFCYPSKEADDIVVLKAIADAAKMKHKTFTCCGGYKSVRNALETRGWIERINIYQSGYDDLTRHLYKLPLNDLIHGMRDKSSGFTHRRVILSKLLGSHQVDLYWDYGNDVYHGNPDSVKLTMINSIQRGVFSYATKNGLCESSKDAHWYNKPGKCNLMHPRSYSISSVQKPDDFMRDFKINACMSMMKWIVDVSKTKSTKLISDHGKISIVHFQFAVKECVKLIQRLKHEDIDKNIPEASEKEWNLFLDAYSEAVHRSKHFRTNIYETETTIVHKSHTLLEKLKKCWPYCDMDGCMNIWILKPSHGSRGIGIHICRTLDYVLKILNENKNHHYVVQKYIERPLLIFNTKFDIRQWFLISSTSPLTIWIYKDCYLRFSSQTYNLRKLHESIHLTNNSVQSRYHSTANRDPSIPDYNMWDLAMFKQHLINIGYAGIFEKIIYPGMKECITAAILMNQDHLNKRRNSFQLHGADFMLTENFQPWLIEINARPALYSSTPITARMCPKVLTDTIRVVIDLKENSNAPTGLFELLYKEEIEKLPNTIFDPDAFVIQGHTIRKDYFQTPEQAIAEGNLCNSRKSSELMDITNNKNFILQVGKEMRATLEQLLTLIHKEKHRRKMLKNHLNSSDGVKLNEVKELYKKDVSECNIENRSSLEIQNVLYNTFSNNVLNNVSKDARHLHVMISKELGMDCTFQNVVNTGGIEKTISSSSIQMDVDELSHEICKNKNKTNAQPNDGFQEKPLKKPSSLIDNFLGMISSLSFN